MSNNEPEKVSRTDYTPWRHADTLRHYYQERGYSLLETAEVLGCTEGTVSQWCNRLNVETRDAQEARTIDRPEQLENEGWMRREYLDKERTCADISEELSVSDLTVSNWLRRHDIPTRSRNRRRDRVTIICENCGGEKEVIKSREKTAKYCSRECYYEDMDMPKGEDHWDWKHGSYHEYQGSNWGEIRECVRERDDYRCQLCGEHEGERELDVHHLTPLRDMDDPHEETDIDNLVTLCRSCHMRAEKYAPLLPPPLD